MDNTQLEPVYPGQSKQKIASIQFSVLPPNEIQKMRTEITTGQMYDPLNHIHPMKNGPLDLRLVSFI
jgi:DNA-directed RNA polymerase beta' subunit